MNDSGFALERHSLTVVVRKDRRNSLARYFPNNLCPATPPGGMQVLYRAFGLSYPSWSGFFCHIENKSAQPLLVTREEAGQLRQALGDKENGTNKEVQRGKRVLRVMGERGNGG